MINATDHERIATAMIEHNHHMAMATKRLLYAVDQMRAIDGEASERLIPAYADLLRDLAAAVEAVEGGVADD